MNLKYKGTTVFYTDDGDGEAVVLLHGFLENSTMWKPFVPKLSQKHRIICIDLLGHGKTGCLGYIHTMELMADVVKSVLEHLNIEIAMLIGHSMGGYVALAFAEKYPNYINGLCLMNSTAREDATERKKNRDRAIKAVKENHERFVKMGISNLFRPKNRIIFSEEIVRITHEALQTPLQGIIAALEGMKIRKGREYILQNFRFKCMMMVSKRDPVLNYNTLIDQVKGTKVTLVEFPDGHMSHIENKNNFLQSMVFFVEKK